MMTIRTISFAATAAILSLASTLQAQSTPSTATRPATSQPGAAPVTGSGPNGATLRCRDGSYPATGAPDSACENRGGVLVRFPMRLVPPAPAAAERVAPAAAAAPALRDSTPPAGFVPFAERQAQRKAEAERAARVPANATLLCVDGSYVQADTSSVRCANRGGVKLRFSGAAPAQQPGRQRPRGG